MSSNDTLKLIVLNGCTKLGKNVNNHLKDIRNSTKDYIVPISQTRFNNGEGKIKILETIRNKDVYIITDIGNHSCTYQMFGYTNHMGPDEHFQDIKRAISAIKGQADSITIIMPLLYSSRQHRRKGRESLDCAIALQELQSLGVKNITTFDVHDPNIQNATPCFSFENFYPTHTILDKFIDNENIDFENLLVISPDTGAMDRARYFADILKTDVGMFYKRRDLSKIVDGKNPIIAHEYLGKDVNGKNVIIVDDMISSGQSMLEVAEELKKRGAEKIYLITTYSLFDKGVDNFNQAYSKGYFNKVYSTNLSYIADEVKNQQWFCEVDCSNFIANIINAYNNHESISPLMNGKDKILDKINKVKNI